MVTISYVFFLRKDSVSSRIIAVGYLLIKALQNVWPREYRFFSYIANYCMLISLYKIGVFTLIVDACK